MPSAASARTSRASMSARFGVVVVVVAEQMQRAVDDQMRRMVARRRCPCPPASAVADAAGKDDIAKQQFWSGNVCVLQIISVSAIGKERTLVGLSLPRHWR